MGVRSVDAGPSWSREAVSVVGVLTSVGLLFSLATRHGPQNLLGTVGQEVADGLVAAFGVLAYGAAVAGLAVSIASLVFRMPAPRWTEWLWGAMGFTGVAILLDRFGYSVAGPDTLASGAFGARLAEGMQPWIGPLGTALVGVGTVLIPVLALFRWSLRSALLDAGRWVGTAVRVSGRVTTTVLGAMWRAAPEAEEASEAETDVETEDPDPVSLPPERPRKTKRTKARKAPSAPPVAPPDEPELGDLDLFVSDDPPPPDDGEVDGLRDPSRTAREKKARKSPPPAPAASEPPAEAPAGEDEGPVIVERRPMEAPPERSRVIKVKAEKQTYELPPLHLLDYAGEQSEPVDGLELRGRATRLEQKLRTYGVEGKVTAIRPGPVVTTYEYQPAPGVKVSKIANLADDIAMSMEAVRVRIVAPIPGRGVVGIELPNDSRENVYLKELVAHDRFQKSKGLLTLAMGKDAEGDVQVRDLQKMPHLLIAGTTGSGKSVSINTMILSILYKATPDQVKFIMVDPKMLELSLYNDIPHLLLPVVTDPRKASRALQWAVDEMERRYKLLSDLKVRDIDGFNRKLGKLGEARAAGDTEPRGEEPPKMRDPWPGQDLPESMPYIVVLIDEFADLMCVAPRDVEASVQRLAQKARAAGIHVLLATQRPSTDVITGVIKNNFPSRVSFRVASRHDSSTVLNAPGAENLLGRGDSLFLSVAAPMAERIHGGFVSEEEVERVVDFWKKQARPKYDATILQPKDDDEGDGFDADDVDEHYDMAVQIVTESRRASISGLQRRLRVGYNRAARMIEMMEHQGIVGPAVGAKGEREVLVPPPPDVGQ